MDPFKSFAAKRIFLGILFLGVVLWVIGTFLGSFEAPSSPTGTETATVADTRGDSAGHEPSAALIRAPGEVAGSHETPRLPATPEEKIVTAPGTPTAPHETAKAPEVSHSQSAKADHQTGDGASSKAAPHGVDTAAQEHDLAPGVLFVDAIIAPLDYELNERFWGWRHNDILNFTDNVNNFQLGVLEVTRRAVITLTERISRTGTTAALDPNLEDATNWLMLNFSTPTTTFILPKGWPAPRASCWKRFTKSTSEPWRRAAPLKSCTTPSNGATVPPKSTRGSSQTASWTASWPTTAPTWRPLSATPAFTLGF